MAHIPAELIQIIYLHLNPTDFYSARRVCRSWMDASQNAFVVREQMLRGGWSGAKCQLSASGYVAWECTCEPARDCRQIVLPSIPTGQRVTTVVTSLCGKFLLAAAGSEIACTSSCPTVYGQRITLNAKSMSLLWPWTPAQPRSSQSWRDERLSMCALTEQLLLCRSTLARAHRRRCPASSHLP